MTLYNLMINLSKPVRSLYGLFNSKFKEREHNSVKHLYELENEGRLWNKTVPTIWIHVASLGEYKQAEPIINRLKSNDYPCRIIVTVFSPSGYRHISNPNIDKLIYLPFDTKQNAGRLVNSINPDLVIFVRYEIWQNYLDTLKDAGIETWLIAATKPNSLSSNTWFRTFILEGYSRFTKLFPVNQDSATWFENHGVNTDKTISDPRYDGILNKINQFKLDEETTEIITHYTAGRPILILGSAWKKDDDVIANIIKAKHDSVFCIHVPHEPTEEYLQQVESSYSNSVRFSKLKEKDYQSIDTLIIDKIGLLLALYDIADLAYVGGGFGDGIHSVGEAVGSGLPIAGGKPRILTSPESKLFIEENVLRPIADSGDFKGWLTDMLDESNREEISLKASQLAKRLSGGADTFSEMIKKALS